MNDIFLNKSAAIQRYLKRIGEEFRDEVQFRHNFTQQDSVILNLQRACEAAIDIANHLIRQYQFGLPQSSRESFSLLAEQGVIEGQLAENLQKMVGLRNIAVHDYQTLNMDIVIHAVRHRLNDFTDYLKQVALYSQRHPV